MRVWQLLCSLSLLTKLSLTCLSQSYGKICTSPQCDHIRTTPFFVEVHKLRKMSAEFPASSQLLRLMLPRKLEASYEEWATSNLHYMYNTSYEDFSRTNKFSRSALLANLPALMAQLDTCKNVFTSTFNDFPQPFAMRIHDIKHEGCVEAYKAWHALAASKVQESFRAVQVREWEVNGGKPRVDLSQQSGTPSMREMLAELRSLARDGV